MKTKNAPSNERKGKTSPVHRHRAVNTEFTIYEVLEFHGKVVFGDKSREEICTWDGVRNFARWHHDGKGNFHMVDGWEVSSPPLSVDQAVGRCLDKLALVIHDENSCFVR